MEGLWLQEGEEVVLEMRRRFKATSESFGPVPGMILVWVTSHHPRLQW